MKRASWYVVAGTVAGFAGVVGLHSKPATPSLALHPKAAGHPAVPAAGPSPATAPPAGPAAPTGPARTATGVMEQYGYGELSAAITVRGGQITNVSVPVLRTAEPYSQQLADQVIPMLKSEVLAAHSAHINAISGATYTSLAYQDSIQSALDKLHIR
ncbi:MAG TPA: FMN-binding protein [Streptosporangiaceae bacterium]|nr:FMN-binding protein [Streptosporangiaceae bacterium]